MFILFALAYVPAFAALYIAWLLSSRQSELSGEQLVLVGGLIISAAIYCIMLCLTATDYYMKRARLAQSRGDVDDEEEDEDEDDEEGQVARKDQDVSVHVIEVGRASRQSAGEFVAELHATAKRMREETQRELAEARAEMDRNMAQLRQALDSCWTPAGPRSNVPPPPKPDERVSI